jgi:hypothetical protein
MTEHQQQRLQKRRLQVLEEAASCGNVAKTCRRYGISRELFYRWRRRYQAQGVTGLRNQHHAPHHCPVRLTQTFCRRFCICANTTTWGHGAFACICCVTMRS